MKNNGENNINENGESEDGISGQAKCMAKMASGRSGGNNIAGEWQRALTISAQRKMKKHRREIANGRRNNGVVAWRKLAVKGGMAGRQTK
jgi:hypothetical protein